ncbi:hypothetical protein RCL_jg21412.t1 [Rhizophagus clarus]|uniref:Uncharacterized protein n=1 Tax=Rhizophagus clarus TaxID=94130 RepID=A0A8H3LV78_9GLOM|nr:hypothetical protein RCL_jg21412.t1 [Rhizophagus clarus]
MYVRTKAFINGAPDNSVINLHLEKNPMKVIKFCCHKFVFPEIIDNISSRTSTGILSNLRNRPCLDSLISLDCLHNNDNNCDQ